MRGLHQHVAFACDCGATVGLGVGVVGEPLARPRSTSCAACGREHPLAPERVDEHGGLLGCARCGHPELYTKKDFPRALGLAILVVAAVLAPFTYYVSLAVAALLDLALYHLVPEVATCYVCGAEHRGFAPRPRHPRYDPEIGDRVRFGERAVMGKPMRPEGTADAPEPEH